MLPGVYTLQVISIQYNFPTYKLDVKPSGRIRAILFPYLGAERVACSYPLRIEPNAQRGYFEPRPQVGLGYILKNPMVLMMLFSVGMMYIMPKMMYLLHSRVGGAPGPSDSSPRVGDWTPPS